MHLTNPDMSMDKHYVGKTMQHMGSKVVNWGSTQSGLDILSLHMIDCV